MKIALLQTQKCGKANTFLLQQMYTKLASQQGHQFVSQPEQAELVIVEGEQLPELATLLGKKVYQVSTSALFNSPEQTFAQALTESKIHQSAEMEQEQTALAKLRQTNNIKNIVAVTACPSGVTQTFMAAEAITNYAQQQGWQIKVETKGQIGADKLITTQDIAQADLIFLASDVELDLARFEGKLLYRTSTKQALKQTANEFDKAFSEAKLYRNKPKKVAHTNEQTTPQVTQVVSPRTTTGTKNIVAVTACPTGVAHTFMSAEAIQTYAQKQGWNIKVETRGQVGSNNLITAEDVANADLVFIAADIDVDLTKFDGKPMYRTSTGLALKKTAEEFEKAFAQATIYHAKETKVATKQNAGSTEKKGVYSHLMTGVSHMLPMVVAGGLIIALSFLFGIEAFKQEGTLAAALMQIGGGSAFGLMIPILAGYIAYSIADRPGLTPGLVGGMLASSLGAGFIGGIIAGFLAGYTAKAITDYIKLPATMNALKPILIIPFFSTLIVGLIMIYVVGEPVAWIMQQMTQFLTGMQSGSAVLLGIILGAMMCFDMGGPVNKAAYTFGVGLLASSTYLPMAAVMAAGMVPALGMGIATFIARNKFSDNEREGGKASFVLGLCFISEGAIPFAARDPMRVIPSCMVGGALTGALSMLFGAELVAPHGGIFVLAIPGAIQPVLLYLIAIAAGSLVTGIGYAIIKPKTLAA